MVSEIIITVRNDEKRQTTKHLVYEPYTVDQKDPIIKELMDQAVKEFGPDVPDKVQIKVTMEVE